MGRKVFTKDRFSFYIKGLENWKGQSPQEKIEKVLKKKKSARFFTKEKQKLF